MIRHEYMGAYAPSFSMGESSAGTYMVVRFDHVLRKEAEQQSLLLRDQRETWQDLMEEHGDWLHDRKLEWRQEQRSRRAGLEGLHEEEGERSVGNGEVLARNELYERWLREWNAIDGRDQTARDARAKEQQRTLRGATLAAAESEWQTTSTLDAIDNWELLHRDERRQREGLELEADAELLDTIGAPLADLKELCNASLSLQAYHHHHAAEMLEQAGRLFTAVHDEFATLFNEQQQRLEILRGEAFVFSTTVVPVHRDFQYSLWHERKMAGDPILKSKELRQSN